MAGMLGDNAINPHFAKVRATEYDLRGSRPVDVVAPTNPSTEAEKRVWLAVALLAKERAAFEVEKATARLDDATAEYERIQALPVMLQLVRRDQPVNELTARFGGAASGDTGSGFQ